MNWQHKVATWLAWKLPEPLVYWAVVRAATATGAPTVADDGFPGDRTVVEVLDRWVD